MSESGSAARERIVGDDDVASFRELREYSRGTLDVGHRHIHPHAGLVEDEEVAEVLSFMAEEFDRRQAFGEDADEDAPRDFWETDFAEKALRKYGTAKATQAIQDGNLTQAAYLSGLPSYESDVSGMHAINQLAHWLVNDEQCKLIYIAALMGRGKTDMSLLFYQVIHDHYRRVRETLKQEGMNDALGEFQIPEFAANFAVSTPEVLDVEVRHIDRYDDLVAWGGQGDSDDERWFIFDEASTELTAQSGANAQDVAERFAPFVKKMRKMGINMIVIGHDKGDVHPAIRALADFVAKGSLTKAQFWEGVKKREPVGHLFDVNGIPPTSWSYDTNDTADWDWCDETEESLEQGISHEEFREWRDTRIARIYETCDIGQEDLADAIEMSQSHVTKAVKQYGSQNGSGGNPA